MAVDIKEMFCYAVGLGIVVCVLMWLGKKPSIEGMTGGFGTITGLAFNNPMIICKGGNATGSSSPFCEGSGYVLQ
jgi:hypothetical protein